MLLKASTKDTNDPIPSVIRKLVKTLVNYSNRLTVLSALWYKRGLCFWPRFALRNKQLSISYRPVYDYRGDDDDDHDDVDDECMGMIVHIYACTCPIEQKRKYASAAGALSLTLAQASPVQSILLETKQKVIVVSLPTAHLEEDTTRQEIINVTHKRNTREKPW
ncbi:hypothetical protein PoB_006574100 [Plakobranchus ocellatus]|uniref:Uncharacterized protein n=1 Tax=Plakobranchus ocellatus TaxID=259542 RepID=A0AAV4D4Y6_9GAST|nr:hypothetical protein PoB_006574100 [Plakobranchus ocellatus]